MSIKILRQYSICCWLYGWEKSFAGLRAFEKQIKTGMRPFK